MIRKQNQLSFAKAAASGPFHVDPKSSPSQMAATGDPDKLRKILMTVL
jgi:hypothetical protein